MVGEEEEEEKKPKANNNKQVKVIRKKKKNLTRVKENSLLPMALINTLKKKKNYNQ